MISVPHPHPGDNQASRKLLRYVLRRVVLIAVCVVPLFDGAALARVVRAPNETPARVGNIWGGFDHQPVEPQVQSAERARGDAPTVQEQSRESEVVQQLYQELLMRAGAGRSSATAG